MDYEPPTLAPPFRVLMLAASTEGWYGASAEARAAALDVFGALLERFGGNGARLVASFDDDLFATGQPASLSYSIFAVYDVDDLSVVVQLVHELRTELGHMLRLEARVGRRLFLLEN